MKNLHAKSLAFALVSVAALSTTFSACSSTNAGSASGTYKVVVVYAETGEFAVSDGGGGAALRVYFAKLNKAGGINGKKFDVTYLDSMSTPTQQEAQMRAAVAANPIAIFYYDQSTGLAAAAPTVLKGTNISVLTSTATDSLLTPTPNSHIFNMVGTQAMLLESGLQEAEFALGGTLQGKRIGIMAAQSAYCETTAMELGQQAKARRASVSDIQFFTPGATSLDVQARSIVASNTDVVLFCANSADNTTAAHALTVAGFHGLMIAPTAGNDSIQILQSIGNPKFYALRVVKTPAQTALASLAGSNIQNAQFTLGWMSGIVMTDALKKCGVNCNAAELNRAIDDVGTFNVGNLAFGPVQFSKTERAGVRVYEYVNLPKGAHAATPAGKLVTVREG
jgi:branched-chain amino acid transport system substrate-binding protein